MTLRPFSSVSRPVREPVDDLLLAHLGAAEVEHRLAARVDAEFGRIAHRAQDLGGLEELLGRDATPVQTRSADALLFHERDVQPGGGAVERGGIAGRASAEDHDVEFVGQNGHLLRAS